MKTRSDIALEKFFGGYNCAQAVLYSFCDDLNFDKNTALRLACGFGGGMGRKQEVCGAISGGIIAIGLKYGQSEAQDKTAKEETYRKVHDLISRFEAKHGASLCRELLKGCDLSAPEGQRYFKENDLLNKVCKGCVVTVVELVEGIATMAPES